ncbi:hypothetical protein [Streptomyces sp. NPDC047061]|uniref:hypothetical protein n=1 Tax=Streptomyces sp. NPDC047061 TaxID=3154605 RepID=UPI0033F9B8FE
MNVLQEDTERSGTAPAPYTQAVIAKRGLDEPHHRTQAIVAIVIAEDAPSQEPGVHPSAHLPVVDAMVKQQRQPAAGDLSVIVGGIIPAACDVGDGSVLEWAC